MITQMQRLDGYGGMETYNVYWQPIPKPKKIKIRDAIILDKGTSKKTVSNGKELMEAISGICAQILQSYSKTGYNGKFVLRSDWHGGSCPLKDKTITENWSISQSYGIQVSQKKNKAQFHTIRYKHGLKKKTYSQSKVENIVLREERILPSKKANKIEFFEDSSTGARVYSKYTVLCTSEYCQKLRENYRKTVSVEIKLYDQQKKKEEEIKRQLENGSKFKKFTAKVVEGIKDCGGCFCLFLPCGD